MPTVGRKAEGKHTQSVLFPKSDWSKSTSKAWLKSHDYYTDGYESTDDFHRWRQYDPESNKFRYRNKKITSDGKSITLVLGFPKGKSDSLATLLFGYMEEDWYEEGV